MTRHRDGVSPVLRRLAIALALVTAGGAAAQSGPAPRFQDEASKQAEIYNSRGPNVPSGYVIGRSLLSYAYNLPEGFRAALGGLKPTQRWLDIGAGEGRAVLDYRASQYDALLPGARESGGKAQVVALSIEDRRTERWREAAAVHGEGIRYLHGRRLREYTAEELGQFHLMTDFLGAFSYTRYVSRFMEKALGLLAVEGRFYTLLQDVQAERADNRPHYAGSPFLTELVREDGSPMTVCTWLKSIACAEVTCEFKPDATPPIEVYGITKTCAAVRVPELVPVHFAAGTPPERRFLLREQAPGGTARPVAQP